MTMKPKNRNSVIIAESTRRVPQPKKSHWAVVIGLLMLGMLSASAVPSTLIMQSFNATIPSINLVVDRHDGLGPQTMPTGPITLSIDPNAIGTVTTSKGQHTMSFGYVVTMPLFTNIFGPGFQDTGTFFEMSQSTQNPLVFSGSGKTKQGIVSITINNNWNCTVTNAAKVGGGTTALIVAGTASWNTPDMQLVFPAGTTGVSFDQVFSNLTVSGSAVLTSPSAPVVLPMTSFSGTISPINLMIDLHDGSGPKQYGTGPISLNLDPRVGGSLTSAGGLQTIAFGFQVNSPLFLSLFGTNFDSGTYMESSMATGDPFVFTGAGLTTRGVVSIDINNNWNCKNTAARMVPGPATWNTTTMQLSFPASTTGMPTDQVFSNLTASGDANFASPPPVVLAMSSFSGTIPSVNLQVDLHDGSGPHVVPTGPISLGLDTNAAGTVKSGGGLQTISFGYTVSVPGLGPLLGASYQDTGSYIETSTSTTSPFLFTGKGVSKGGTISIDINNNWNSTVQNNAMAPGPATWHTTTMELDFPAALTGTESTQTFTNLTVTNGTAVFIAEPAPVELAFNSFGGTIPSVNLQVDLHDGLGPRIVPTGPMTLSLDTDVGGLVSSGNGLQTLSFGFTVEVPGMSVVLGTNLVQHGTYVETSTSPGNPFLFSGSGRTGGGVVSIDINNNWNSKNNTAASIAPGPATWNTATMQLVFPAAMTGMPADQTFYNLSVTNGAANFVVQPRPIAVTYGMSNGKFNVTYQNLDPSKLYTLYRGSTPLAFPTQVGTAFTGVSSMDLTDPSPPVFPGGYYILRGK